MRLRALGVVVVIGCGSPGSAPSTDVERDASQASASQQTLARECDGGEASSCNVLAAMLLVGKGTAVDATKAREVRRRAGELYVQACTKGDTVACKELPYSSAYPGVRIDGVSAPVPLTEGEELPPTIHVVIAADGNVMIDGQLASADAMDERFAKACKVPGLQAIVTADAASSYGRVLQVIDTLKTHGCGKYAFAMEVPTKAPPAKPPQ